MAKKKFNRKQMKTQMKKRQEEKTPTSEVFDFYLELPDGTNRWFPKAEPEGEGHFFDLVLFQATEKYPTKTGFTGKPGDWVYKLDIYYHKNIGPEGKQIPCPKKNYGLPCPVCEDMTAQFDVEEDKDARSQIWTDLGPKLQTVYNVIIMDEEGNRVEEDVQVFNQPFSFMQEYLEKISNPPRGGKVYFANPDAEEGKTIYFEKKSKGSGGNYDNKGHQFVDRDYEISDEDLENALNLDEFIKEFTYEEIEEIYSGSPKSAPKKEKEEVAEEEVEEEVVEEEDVPMHEAPDTDDDSDSDGDEVNEFEEFMEGDVFVKCPEGSEKPFGEEHDMYNECEGCPAFKDCKAAKTPKKPSKKRPTMKK